jgi:quinol-cytochrome oxidoreductase complex cytochrome b subunit
VLGLLKNSLVELPTPKSISFLWNMGFLLGITLIRQIVTGLMLSINYVASTEIAFDSVIHIIRDIDSGWAMRYVHMNGASLFFLLMYIHIARGVYFNSPKKIPIV